MYIKLLFWIQRRQSVSSRRSNRLILHGEIICSVCYRHFRFKSWYVAAIQVQTLNGFHVDRVFLIVNYLILKTARGVKVVMALSNLSLGKTFVTCLVSRSFATECICCYVEDMIQPVAAPICSLNVGFTSNDLNQSGQSDSVF